MKIDPRIGDYAIGALDFEGSPEKLFGTVTGVDMGAHGMVHITSKDGDEGYFYPSEVTVLQRPEPAAPEAALPLLESAPPLSVDETREFLSGEFMTGAEFLASLDSAENGTVEGAENPKDRLGVKKAPLRFVPPALSILAAPAMALGAAKYGPMNWRTKAVKLSVYLEAIDRHLAAYKDRQDNDPESGASHLSHVAACLGIIADAEALGMLEDDRMLRGPASAMLEALDRTKEV